VADDRLGTSSRIPLVALWQPDLIMEIGRFNGYSAIWLAEVAAQPTDASRP